jgi:hypothetical protein
MSSIFILRGGGVRSVGGGFRGGRGGQAKAEGAALADHELHRMTVEASDDIMQILANRGFQNNNRPEGYTMSSRVIITHINLRLSMSQRYQQRYSFLDK